VGEQEIDAAILKGQFVGQALLELRVGNACCLCCVPRHRDLGAFAVNTNYRNGGRGLRRAQRLGC
jgi:hypothetical protein